MIQNCQFCQLLAKHVTLNAQITLDWIMDAQCGAEINCLLLKLFLFTSTSKLWICEPNFYLRQTTIRVYYEDYGLFCTLSEILHRWVVSWGFPSIPKHCQALCLYCHTTYFILIFSLLWWYGCWVFGDGDWSDENKIGAPVIRHSAPISA